MCLSKSLAVGRLCGSCCRQFETKSLNDFENPASNRGGGFLGITNNARITCRSAYGGSPLAISIAVIPRDHINRTSTTLYK